MHLYCNWDNKLLLNENSIVYTLFLDASKAFDKVNHNKLFNILMEKGICPIMLRLIINMYKIIMLKLDGIMNILQLF